MSNSPLFDPKGSQRKAERGQNQTARANAAAVAEIAQAFLDHLQAIRPEPGSMDTLRAAGFQLPPMTNPNAIGAGIGRLSRADLIRCVGVTRGNRLTAHRAKIYLWKLTQDVIGAVAGEVQS